jgi:ribosomal-protein-alanine N-acetyltransferase
MSLLLPVGVAHGAVLAAIHAACFPPGARWGADAMVLQLSLPGAFGVAVQTAPDQPAGFVLARVAADEAEILTIAVLPAARRQGLGDRLLDAAEIGAAERGAASMFLEVAETNAAARALYLRRGYRQVGLRRGYYAPGLDALVLRRTLTPAAARAG